MFKLKGVTPCIFVAIFPKDLFRNPLSLRSAVYKRKPPNKALRVPTAPGHMSPKTLFLLLIANYKDKRRLFWYKLKKTRLVVQKVCL